MSLRSRASNVGSGLVDHQQASVRICSILPWQQPRLQSSSKTLHVNLPAKGNSRAAGHCRDVWFCCGPRCAAFGRNLLMIRAFSPMVFCQIEPQYRRSPHPEHEKLGHREHRACVMSFSNSSIGVRAATLSRTTRSKHLGAETKPRCLYYIFLMLARQFQGSGITEVSRSHGTCHKAQIGSEQYINNCEIFDPGKVPHKHKTCSLHARCAQKPFGSCSGIHCSAAPGSTSYTGALFPTPCSSLLQLRGPD